MKSTRFLYIDDIPTPYRLGVYRQFEARFPGSFRVLYCAASEAGRDWTLSMEGLDARVLEGRQFRLPGMDHAYSYKWNAGIRREIHQFDPHVVAVSGYMHPSVQMAAWHCRRRGIPYGMDCETSFLQKQPRSWRMRLKRTLLGPLVRGMSFGLPCGSKAEEYLRALGARDQPMFPLPNTPDIEDIDRSAATVTSEDARRRFLESFSMPNDKRIVLFVGRLVDVKRPLDLVEAFERLPEGLRSQLTLTFIGDGPMAAEVRAAAQVTPGSDVRFLGWMAPEDVYRFMALADLKVLPSGKEPWGAVVNECMAAGTPVLASDKVGAAHDLIEHGVTGWMYPAGDVDRLTEVLREALAAAHLLPGISQRAREAARRGDAVYAAESLLGAVEYAVG